MIKLRNNRRGLAAALVAGCLVMALAGCSSSGTSDASVSDADVDAGVEEAARVAKLANTTLLYGPTTGAVKADQLRAPEPSDIKAFAYKPSAGPKPTIAILSCAAVSAQCVHTTDLIHAYLGKLDIESSIINSDYTPAGNQQAMNTALSKNVDAIILDGIAPKTIGAQLARAKESGVFVAAVVGTPDTIGGNLDAYVPQGANLYQAAVAAQITVETEGRGVVTWLTAPEFPELEEFAGTGFLKEVCPGCSLTEGTETAEQVTNPVKMGGLVTSFMRRTPGTDYFTLASACADLQSASAALRQTDAKLAGGGCGGTAVAAMNAGYLSFATGTVEPWGALAVIDQVLRLLAGEKPLPVTEVGPAAYLFTPESTPDESTDGSYAKIDQWSVDAFDFVKPYSDAWGVDLSSVIAGEK